MEVFIGIVGIIYPCQSSLAAVMLPSKSTWQHKLLSLDTMNTTLVIAGSKLSNLCCHVDFDGNITDTMNTTLVIAGSPFSCNTRICTHKSVAVFIASHMYEEVLYPTDIN